MQNTAKLIIAVLIAVIVASFLFRFLWKIGLLALLVLGIIYLYQRVAKR